MASFVSTNVRRNPSIVIVAFTSLACSSDQLSEEQLETPTTDASPAEDSPAGNDDGGAVDLNGGILLDDGAFIPLADVPDAAATVHIRVDNAGLIAGTYTRESGQASGFVMDRGAVTTIHVPGSVTTIAVGLNDHREVVGAYVEPGAPVDPETGESPTRGFLWAKGVFTKLDSPGAISTAPYDIDNSGRIVGNYVGADRVQHGFVLVGGAFTTIDHPDATRAPDLTATRLVGTNDHGKIVGSYGDDAGTIRAFVRDEDGSFTTFDLPGDDLLAEASGIDNRGRVVGRYLDATPTLRGFQTDGHSIATIDGPGGRCETAPFDINDRGQILIAPTGSVDGTTCAPDGAPAPALLGQLH